MEEGYIPEEQGIIGNIPMPEEKHNVHTFLHAVATSKDTTKTGYLSEEELGMPRLPLRTHKELALFCKDIAGMDYFGKYFAAKGEILTATSLSKNAKLINLGVLQKQEVADVTPKERKPNRGWFKSRNKRGVDQQQPYQNV